MERNHKKGCDPIDRLGKRFVALEDANHSLQSCYDFLSARFTPSLRLRGRAALLLGGKSRWRSELDYDVVTELGFRATVQRKNRKSHISHRNGLTKTMARIPRSSMPLRLDRWIFRCDKTPNPNPILRHRKAHYLSRFEHPRLTT